MSEMTGTAMNPEIKAEWVAELRSGKYKQGRRKLHYMDEEGDYFCCLGVLCEIGVRHGAIAVNSRPHVYFEGRTYEYGDADDFFRMGSETLLPKIVQEWAGLTGELGDIPNEHKPRFDTPTLASMNDKGMTFTEIAAVIEKAF